MGHQSHLKSMLPFNVSLGGNLVTGTATRPIVLRNFLIRVLVRHFTWAVDNGAAIRGWEAKFDGVSGIPFSYGRINELLLILSFEGSSCFNIDPVFANIILIFVTPERKHAVNIQPCK